MSGRGSWTKAQWCAVKTTKGTDLEGTAELLREASLMALVEHHANIVSLVGVVTSGTPLLLLITFCEHGALSACLKRKLLPATKTRLGICLDVARGMHHLAINSLSSIATWLLETCY
eukprot:gene25993-biopygen17514